MAKTLKIICFIVLATALTFSGNAQGNSNLWASLQNPTTVAQLKSFVAAKEAQANAATNVIRGATPPPALPVFFAAAEKGN
jgi:hypothetical protein